MAAVAARLDDDDALAGRVTDRQEVIGPPLDRDKAKLTVWLIVIIGARSMDLEQQDIAGGQQIRRLHDDRGGRLVRRVRGKGGRGECRLRCDAGDPEAVCVAYNGADDRGTVGIIESVTRTHDDAAALSGKILVREIPGPFAVDDLDARALAATLRRCVKSGVVEATPPSGGRRSAATIGGCPASLM